MDGRQSRRVDGPLELLVVSRADDCISDGVIINGVVSIVAVADLDVHIDDDDDEEDGLDASVVIDYDGVLELDGDIEGTCSIDAEVTAHAVVFEHFASAGVTVEGTVCGHDADEIVRR